MAGNNGGPWGGGGNNNGGVAAFFIGTAATPSAKGEPTTAVRLIGENTKTKQTKQT